MSPSQQALYFVDHLYGITPTTPTTRPCAENDTSTPKSQEQDFQMSVRDAWDLSFDNPNKGSNKSNVHRVEESTIKSPIGTSISGSSSSTDENSPRETLVTCSLANGSTDGECPTGNPIILTTPIAYSPTADLSTPTSPITSPPTVDSRAPTSSTSAILNDGSSTSECSNAKLLSDPENSSYDESQYPDTTKEQHCPDDTVSRPAPMVIDVTAVFGDEDDELESLIEEEKSGAAWRNCLPVDLDELKKPFAHGLEEVDLNIGEEYTSENVRGCPSKTQSPQNVLESISAEERHRRFLTWTHKIRPSVFQWYNKQETPGNLLRMATTECAYANLDPAEWWLHKKGALPKGTTGELRPVQKYPSGPRGPSRLREVMYANEEPPNPTSPAAIVDSQERVASSEEEEESESSAGHKASSASSFPDEELSEAECPHEFDFDEEFLQVKSPASVSSPVENVDSDVYENWFQEGVLDKIWSIEASSVVIAKHLASHVLRWFRLPF